MLVMIMEPHPGWQRCKAGNLRKVKHQQVRGDVAAAEVDRNDTIWAYGSWQERAGDNCSCHCRSWERLMHLHRRAGGQYSCGTMREVNSYSQRMHCAVHESPRFTSVQAAIRTSRNSFPLWVGFFSIVPAQPHVGISGRVRDESRPVAGSHLQSCLFREGGTESFGQIYNSQEGIFRTVCCACWLQVWPWIVGSKATLVTELARRTPLDSGS